MRNTAPALAAISQYISYSEPERPILIMPSDHSIKNMAVFMQAVEQALPFAMANRMVLFGANPTAPETRYGYIQKGSVLENSEFFNVAKFHEKPDAKTAKRYIADGCLWNTGIVLTKAGVMADNFEKLCPLDIAQPAYQAVSRGQISQNAVLLDEASFVR